MTLRAIRGVLAVENQQTGDGRVLAAGSLTWADLPLPFAWLVDGDQHVDLIEVAPQIGTIQTVTRAGDLIEFTGAVDDEIPEGAEFVRRLEAGTGALGERYGVSIDPDDWEVEVVLVDAGSEDGVVIMASGTGCLRSVVRAAAGDPDPGQGGGDTGATLFEDSADAILERYTRMRIRGATACAVAAFGGGAGDGAYCELDPANDGMAADVPPAAPVTAAAAPVAPPLEWFTEAEPIEGDDRLVEQYDRGVFLGLACPLTITDDGQVFGHLAASYEQCHVGYLDSCVTPPMSAVSYAHFHVGAVHCADGTVVPTGALTVGADHAPLDMAAEAARDHYANSGLGWADVHITDGEYGPWVAGALRPDITPEQVRVLRALTLSGDWRRLGGSLELIAALSVNTPGFPVSRMAMAAAGMVVSSTVRPEVRFAAGGAVAMVAAGIVHRCAECERRASEENNDGLGELVAGMRVLLRRTDGLRTSAAKAMAASINGPVR